MSQKTIYKCDGCYKEIGQRPHISIRIQDNASGVAVPPNPEFINGTTYWHCVSFPLKFMHFHNGHCMQKYFDKLLAEFSLKKNESKNNSQR